MDWRVRSVTQLLILGFLFAVTECGTAEQRVVCYYTNWSVYRPGTAKFSPQNINPYLCTHLIYAFGGFTKENTLKPFDKYQDIEKGGYAKFTGLKTYNKNLKTMLAVGGWNEGSTRFSPMVADPERRKQFVRNTVKFLRQNHFDGLDLDWEYPAFRDGGKPRDRDNYASLVQELREAYERESSKTGRPRLLLSMAVPAGIEYINKGYDIPKLNKYLDFINLLSYDYHSSYEPAVNHHSPLYPLEEDNEYNFDTELTVDYTIKHLLDSGASADKIVLGIPTYGRSYTLFNEDATDIGSPADGPGEEGDATREKGYLAYYEICEALIQSEDWEVVSPNPNAMGPYAYKGNQWVGYDDEAIVRLKAQYVTENGLGGIMFWSIDNDDFRGKCHDRPYPLIEAAKEAMLAGSEKTGASEKSTRPSKTRTDSNFIGRKLGAGRRRTTEAPVVKARQESPRKRVNSLRSRNRSNNRDNLDEEDEPQVQINGRNRAQFFGSEEDEEDDVSHNTNAVRSIASSENQDEEAPAPQRSQNGKQARRRRPENSRRRSTTEASISEPSAAQAGNHRITTPAPPTTPDPGTDFKCEDEGFFSHPRDCKKYFWCLDAGPGGLGIVAHHFTCPAGLVFNKAADSCDYPRNVVCPKTKPDEGPTTRAPIVAATSRTTRIHSTTRRSSTSTTTEPSELSEEYEYYDDEEEEDNTPTTTTTTARTLQYKTISRNRPTTTTSTAAPPTSTEIPKTATSRSYQTIPSRSSSTIAALASIEESEEDPKVIQELIELIKKAGGIEELEKQLHLQGKGSESSGQSSSATNKADVTPATISQSLYQRVLNRQSANGGSTFFRRTTIPPTTVTTEIPEKLDSQESVPQRSRPNFRNGPGQAQFEGLDDIPEVKSLRKERPQYVTINRQRPSTEAPNETSEEVAEDNSDVASSDQTSLTDPPEERPSTQREPHGYVDIRRSRTSTARSNALEDEDETNWRQQRRRPTTSETEDEEQDENLSKDSPSTTEAIVARRRNQFFVQEEASGTTSRYQTIQRVRSTTTQAIEESTSSEVGAQVIETTTVKSSDFSPAEIITTESPTGIIEDKISTSESTTAAIIEESIIPSTTPSVIESLSTTQTQNLSPTDLPVQISIIDPSTTTLLSVEEPTTVGYSSSAEPVTRGSTTTNAPQQRPFGYQRRTRPTTSVTTETPDTTSSVNSDLGRVKVLRPETVRLPTLKELIGHDTIVAHDHTSTTPIITLSIKILSDEKAGNDPSENNKHISETVTQAFEKDKVESRKDMVINNADMIHVGEEYPLKKYTTLETARNNKQQNGIDENSVSHLVQSSTESSSPSTLPIRILKQDQIKPRRRRVKLVNIPVRILESDRPVTDVILQVPEYKLNSVLRSLLRVEIINNEKNENESSNESKNVNIHSQRTRYNVENQNYGKDGNVTTENESNELLNNDANTNPILADNKFTSTTPSVSTLRGSPLVTPRKSRNRGFYVTKNIESSTNSFENVTPQINVQATEVDNEITQEFITTTDRPSTSENYNPSTDEVTTTESYYTAEKESSTITEQLSTIAIDNFSTIRAEDSVSTTSNYRSIMQEAFGPEKSWPLIISTSLENFNNILADNKDVDRAEMPYTSTESSSSTTEAFTASTESDDNFYTTDSGYTIESHSTREYESSTESSTSESERTSTTTSGAGINTITDHPDYHTTTPDTRQTTIDQEGYSTTESSAYGFEARALGEGFNSDIETISTEPDIQTTTVSDFDERSTTDHENGVTSTESTGFNTEVSPYSSPNPIESRSAFNTQTESTTESVSDYPTTIFVTDNPIDNDSDSQPVTSTESSETVSYASDIDLLTTTISNIGSETNTPDFTTASSLSTDSILDDSITTHGLFTTTESETDTDSFTTNDSVTTDSEIQSTTVSDGESSTISVDTQTVSSLVTSESGSTSSEKKLEETVKESQDTKSSDLEFSSRGFYRSPTAIPGKKTVRRRVIKKRIYGVRRPHIEAIGKNETARDFSVLNIIEKLNRMKNPRQRYIRRRVINHSTGKVVLDEIIKRSSTAVSGNQTIAIIENPEIVRKADEPLESKNTLFKKLLKHRTTYRRQPLIKNQTNSSINANISSQNNSASNDVQSTSVSSTIPNQRRRIIVQRFRYRSSTTSPSPSPSPSPIFESSTLVADVVGQLNSTKSNNNSTIIVKDDHLLRDDKNETNGQDYGDVTIDNLTSGSESYGSFSVYGREELPRTESISEALVGSEDEKSNVEINLFKTRANNQRKPGTLVRQSRPSTSTSVPEDEISTTTSPSTKAPSRVPIRRRFRLGQRQATQSTNADAQSQAITQGDREPVKSVTNDADSDSLDQIGHAQESEVTVAVENPTTRSPGVSTGRPAPFRTSIRRRIITTEAPHQLTTVSTPKPAPRHQTIVRQRQRANPFDKIQQENDQPEESRPRHPAIIDYDYYGDSEESIVGRSRFSGKLSFTASGSFRCLDQGNFPHPNSCKKFITCARMVDGQFVGTEYTCPKRLSYDPVGGICNWSAGLGCKEI